MKTISIKWQNQVAEKKIKDVSYSLGEVHELQKHAKWHIGMQSAAFRGIDGHQMGQMA